MTLQTEDLARILKSARTSKGLSQRELSEKSGLPQAHISKIENGTVDLRVSSLVALARVLELELALVPRKAFAAVQSIVRSSETGGATRRAPDEALRALRRLQKSIDSLPAAVRLGEELAQLKRRAHELQHFSLSAPQVQVLKQANKAVRALRDLSNADRAEGLDELRKTLGEVQRLRNELVHAAATTPGSERARPAYSLDEEEDGDA